ncbi:hypothetical protein HanIR_Chr04g0174801 [Helianthus annuus]|nr:hypothetical protein HanIR_Chr04g0174801 [Helianthus annuus]
MDLIGYGTMKPKRGRSGHWKEWSADSQSGHNKQHSASMFFRLTNQTSESDKFEQFIINV